jgi:metal-dependent amidase/aminoacylase/carboxypeptidase family protein
MKENKKINRALVGAALSLGANVEIVDIPGYSPVIQDKNMLQLAKNAYESMFEGETFGITSEISTGCSDIGDLSMVMPIVHPYCLGASGTSHGSDYYVNDVEAACIKNAKWQLNMLRMLLENGGELAKKIKAEYQPTFPSQKAYLEYVDAINSEGDRIVYNEDGTATADLT